MARRARAEDALTSRRITLRECLVCTKERQQCRDANDVGSFHGLLSEPNKNEPTRERFTCHAATIREKI
jgi:hypothetical protein